MFIVFFFLAHFEISTDTGISIVAWGEKSGFGYSHTLNVYWKMENKVCIDYSGGVSMLKMYSWDYDKGYEFYERLGIGKRSAKVEDEKANFLGGIILGKFSFSDRYHRYSYRPIAFGVFFENSVKVLKIRGRNIYLYGSFNSYLTLSFFLETQFGIRLK